MSEQVKDNKIKVVFSLSRETNDKLRNMAMRSDRSYSGMVEKLIKDYKDEVNN